MARLYRAGLEDSLENREDRLRFHLLLQALFNQWAMAHLYRSSRMSGVAEADISRVLSTPGGRKYWKRALELELRVPDFVAYVQKIAHRIQNDA